MQRAACDRHNSRLPGCEGWAHATGAEHQAPAEQYHRHAASQGTPAMQRTSSCLVGVTGVEGSIVSVPGLRQRRNGLWHANVFDPGTQRTVILGDFATQQQAQAAHDGAMQRQLQWYGFTLDAAGDASQCSHQQPSQLQASWQHQAPRLLPHAASFQLRHGRSKRHKANMCAAPSAPASCELMHPAAGKEHRPTAPTQHPSLGIDDAGSRRDISCAASTTYAVAAASSDSAPAAPLINFGDGASGAMQGAAILRMAQLSEPLPEHGSGTHQLLPARPQFQPQQRSEKQQEEQGQQRQEQGPVRQKPVLGQGLGQGPLQRLTADADDDSVSSAGYSGQQSCASPSTACWGSGARGGAHCHEPLSRSYEQPASSGPGSSSCGTLPFGALGRRAASCPLDIRLAQLTVASAKSHVSSLEAQLAACEANAAKQRLMLQQQLKEAKNAAKRERRQLKQALAVAPGGTVSGGNLPYEPTLQACPPAVHPSPSQAHPSLCPAASYPSYAHPSPTHPSSHYNAPGRSMPLSSHSDGRLQGAADAPRWGSAGGRATAGHRRTVPDQTHEAVVMPQPSGHGLEYSQGGPGYAPSAEAAMMGPYGHPQGSRQRACNVSPRPSGPCNAGLPGKHSALPFDVRSGGVPAHEAWQHGQQQQQLSRQASLPHLQHASSHPLGHTPAAPHFMWPPPHPPPYSTAVDGIPPPQLAWQHSHPPHGSYSQRSHNSHSMGQAWQGAPDSMQQAPAAVHNGERRRKSSKAAAPGPAIRHMPLAHAVDPGHLPPHFPTQPHLHPYPLQPDMPQGHLGAEAHEAHAPEHAPFDPVHAHTSAPYPFCPGYPQQHMYSQPYPCAGACPAPMPVKKRKAKSHKRQHAATPAAAAAGSGAAGPAGASAIPVAAGVKSGHSGMDCSMLHGLAPGGGGGAAWGGQVGLLPTAGAAAECAAPHPDATAGQSMHPSFAQGTEVGAGDADAEAAAVAAAAGAAGAGSPQPRRRRSQTKQPKQSRRAGRGRGGAQAHVVQTYRAANASGIDQGAFMGLGVQGLDTPFADGLIAALAAAAAFEQGQAGTGLQWGAEGAAGAGPSALEQGHASCTGVAAAAVAQDGIGAAGPMQPCEGGAAAKVQQQQQQDDLAAAAMLACSSGGARGAVGAPAPGQPDLAAVADAFPVPESGAAQVPAWDELEQCLFSDADDLFQDLL